MSAGAGRGGLTTGGRRAGGALARGRVRGYLLNADTLAALYGAVPVAVCPACFRRRWAVNGHRTPRRDTRRRLGIAEIPVVGDAHSYTCRQCGAII